MQAGALRGWFGGVQVVARAKPDLGRSNHHRFSLGVQVILTLWTASGHAWSEVRTYVLEGLGSADLGNAVEV